MMCVQNKETFKRVLLRSGMVVCLFLTGCAERTTDYFYRGGAYYHKAEYDAAIFYFSKAIEINPKDAKAYNNRGIAYYNKGEYDRAISDYTKAIEINPGYAMAYINRGVSYNNKGEYERAISDYTKAIEINPRYAATYNDVAWLLATCPDGKYRDGRKAVENATRACELSQWAVPALLDTLAAAYAEVGEFKQAVKWQSKAIELTADENDKAAMQSHLKLYKAGKPYREEKDKLR
jgi:tetratricopeptide (TPR) repeat protein